MFVGDFIQYASKLPPQSHSQAPQTNPANKTTTPQSQKRISLAERPDKAPRSLAVPTHITAANGFLPQLWQSESSCICHVTRHVLASEIQETHKPARKAPLPSPDTTGTVQADDMQIALKKEMQIISTAICVPAERGCFIFHKQAPLHQHVSQGNSGSLLSPSCHV